MAIDIDDIKRRLLIKYPPFGSTMAKVKFIEDDTCYYEGNPTAATDDEAVYFHPDFISSLNKNQQVTVFAHEIAHIVLDHIDRSEGKDPDIWNEATDAVVNANLKKDGLEIVPGMIDREDAPYYDEETLYEKLYNERKQNKNQKGQKPHTSHEKWKKSVDNRKNKNQNSMNGKNKENKNQSSANEENKENKENFTNANELFKNARKERVNNLKKLKKQLIENSTQNKSQGTAQNRNINNIGSATKLVDWRILLGDTCKIDADWTYQNATIEYGVLTPHMEDIKTVEVEILLDTSGSVNKNMLRNFLKECMGILKQANIKVGCFDDRFYGFHTVRSKRELEAIPLKGGGGTNFDVAVNAFTKNADYRIIFTDGESKMPDTEVNAIWIVYGGKKINPKGGKVISIDDEALRKLHCIQSSNNEVRYRGR